MYEQRSIALSIPLLVILILWLTALFVSFGLFAPRNGTVITTLLVAALSVATAIFLILELHSPYSGYIQLSAEPLKRALAHLGK